MMWDHFFTEHHSLSLGSGGHTNKHLILKTYNKKRLSMGI